MSRKIYNYQDLLVVEFEPNSKIEKCISPLCTNSVTRNHTNGIDNNIYKYNETNLEFLIRALKPFEFSIEPKLLKFYDIITSWDHDTIINQLRLENNPQLKSKLEEELGDFDQIPPIVLQDRSFRYQYQWDHNPNPQKLVEVIANRNQSRIWIDSKKYPIERLFMVLKELRRFPLLLVFDGIDTKHVVKQCNIINTALITNNIKDHVDFCCRLPTSYYGTKFNDLIKEHNYDGRLTTRTQVSGIINGGNLPKALLNTNWTPMSVIQLGIFPVGNKTSVYANSCDLIISYCDTCPLDLE